jgi:hypothetical protein
MSPQVRAALASMSSIDESMPPSVSDSRLCASQLISNEIY